MRRSFKAGICSVSMLSTLVGALLFFISLLRFLRFQCYIIYRYTAVLVSSLIHNLVWKRPEGTFCEFWAYYLDSLYQATQRQSGRLGQTHMPFNKGAYCSKWGQNFDETVGSNLWERELGRTLNVFLRYLEGIKRRSMRDNDNISLWNFKVIGGRKFEKLGIWREL